MTCFVIRELKAPPTQKLARPVRTQPIVQRHMSAAQESTASFVPAPTPASNGRRMDRHTPTRQVSGGLRLYLYGSNRCYNMFLPPCVCLRQGEQKVTTA